MKNLKLEVGKTYLTRWGEKVKIVGCTGDKTFPFDGDNYHSYTPDGGYWTSGRESHLDLIAEAPPTFRTFKIPENTREISVSETDGRIVIEFVPEARERGKILVFFMERGWGISESLASRIETYVKEREAQQCK